MANTKKGRIIAFFPSSISCSKCPVERSKFCNNFFWTYLPKQDVRLHLTFGLQMNGTFIVRFYMANLLNLQQVTSNQLIRGLPSMHGFVPTIEWRWLEEDQPPRPTHRDPDPSTTFQLTTVPSNFLREKNTQNENIKQKSWKQDRWACNVWVPSAQGVSSSTAIPLTLEKGWHKRTATLW